MPSFLNALTSNKWVTAMPIDMFKTTIQDMTKEEYELWLLDLDIVVSGPNSNMISFWYGVYFRAKGRD